MSRLPIAFAIGLLLLLRTAPVLAWGSQGHEVVGDIAQALIADNDKAKREVHDILNAPLPSEAEIKQQRELRIFRELTLRQAGPWADCVKAVTHHDGDRFRYELDPNHPEYEAACIPFNSALERARMEDYVKRNWTNPHCSYAPDGIERGCHNTFHFEDVAIQRDSYDRGHLGANDHDLVAAINAAITVLSGQPAPVPFSIRDRKEALLLLTHFLGDLHQPLHVGSVYLDARGALVDPDAAHAIDPNTETAGGNLILDENVNLHGAWDDIPTDIGRASTAELRDGARAVAPTAGPIEGWAAQWATETLGVARQAFDGLTFVPTANGKWTVAYGGQDKHMAYLQRADATKRAQLAKAGARLAQILNALWPRN